MSEALNRSLSLLPNDADIERYVLGSIMGYDGALAEVQDRLCDDCFYDEFHRQIYRTIVELEGGGEKADVIRVKSILEKKPDFDLIELTKISGMKLYGQSLVEYAIALQKMLGRRKLFRVSSFLERHAFNEEEEIESVVSQANTMLSDIFQSSDNAVYTFTEAVEGVYTQITRNLAAEETITGTPTGFKRFDKRSGGLQPTDLFIVAGETSIGKTSFAVSIMRFAALSGKRVAMYSMEMRKEQIAARIVSMETGISSNELLYSRITPSQLNEVDKGVSKLKNLEIYFDDRSTSSIETILSSIRRMKVKYNIDGAVIDYLQILNVNMKGANKEQQMGDVARRLKNIAKDLGIWVMALSQLNRDNQNPVPTLSRLRDSGQIAEAADLVALIYRPEIYGKSYDDYPNIETKGTAMVNIAKGRNTGLMKFICGFNPRITMFYNLDSLPLKTDDPLANKDSWGDLEF